MRLLQKEKGEIVMNTIEIKLKIDSEKESQVALLKYICENLLSEDTYLSSGQIRSMLYDAIDLMN